MKRGYVKSWLPFLIGLLLAPLNGYAETANRALVVIDMQRHFIERGGNANRPANREKVARVLQAQIEAIEAAKRTDTPIIFIEYQNSGPTDNRLKSAAWGAREVVFFEKTTDGFLDDGNAYRQRLMSYLSARHIRTLIITGANGGACVRDSILGALWYHLNVIAYDKAIADFNYDDFLYPYDHYYAGVHSMCRNCPFHETSDLSGIFPSTQDKDITFYLNGLPRILGGLEPSKGCNK